MKIVLESRWRTIGTRALEALLLAGLLAAVAAPAGAACDCGSSDASSPCTGTSISRRLDGVDFRYEFSCSGGACQCGEFATGSYWVAARDAKGRAVSSVRFTAAQPGGEANGMMANPSKATQGLMGGSGQNYSASLNLMTKLPYSASPDTSLVKAATKSNDGSCGKPGSQYARCVVTADVVTVLRDVPPGAGAAVLRPPFAGVQKPLFRIGDLDLTKIPRIPAVSKNPAQESFNKIIDRWESPIWDLCGEGDEGCARADSYRFFFPDDDFEKTNKYGSAAARMLLDDMLSLMGDEPPTGNKALAARLVAERGMDVYYQWKQGAFWPGGAGQKMGRKPAMVWFAALIGDAHPAIQSEIANIASARPRDFHEDGQIFTNAQGNTVWGTPARKPNGESAACDENGWWSMYVAYKRNGNLAKKTCADPYGYIDGPAEQPGGYYMSVTAGPFAAWGFAQHLMPSLKAANNNPGSLDYADRLKGFRSALSRGNVWTAPDPCAGIDPRESLGSCKSIGSGNPSGCKYYGKTWGPKGNGQCVQVSSANPEPRWPGKHGDETSLSNKPSLLSLWGDLRAAAESCSLPGQQGLCDDLDVGGVARIPAPFLQ